MSLVELFILAIGLAMDAFAVSICKGLAIGHTRLRDAAIAGAWFGGFQAGMPLIGYFLGVNFAQYIVKVDHWITLVLLVLIGANMIKESREEEPDDKSGASLAWNKMLVLAIATSIDALAVGVTLAFLDVSIWTAIILIGAITFLLSGLGVKLGSVFGMKYRARAEFAGGAILILLGVKILLEHLGVLNF